MERNEAHSLRRDEPKITGWNLPPGVNESDIPGNRPQDIAKTSKYDEDERV